jgi:hypothetical protein
LALIKLNSGLADLGSNMVPVRLGAHVYRKCYNIVKYKGGMTLDRKDRSDMKVETFEKKHGVPPGTVRNDDGRDTRGDKRLGTLRKKKGK